MWRIFFENNNSYMLNKTTQVKFIWTKNKLSKYLELDEKQKAQQPKLCETKSANSKKKHTYWSWASLQASWAE